MLKTLNTLVRRFFALIFLRLIPLLIIISIVWSGYQVAEGLFRQIEERIEFNDQQAEAPAAATAIALAADITEATAEMTSQVFGEETENAAIAQQVTAEPTTADVTAEAIIEVGLTASDVSTNTPNPPTETNTPTNTAEASQTATTTAIVEADVLASEVTPVEPLATVPGIMLFRATFTLEPTSTSTATETLMPPTATNTPTETVIPPTPTNVPTNTPIPTEPPTQAPLVFATNTPVGDVGNVAPTAVSTQASGLIFATNTPADSNDLSDPISQAATSTLVIEAVTESATTESVPTEVIVSEQVPPATATLAPPTVTPVPATSTLVPPTATPDVQPTVTNTLPPFFSPRTPEPGATINGMAVPTEVPLVPREYNLFNLILLGGDDQITNDGSVRTDTMIMVSINKDTNTVSMMSLPRDLYVYIPTENGIMGRLNTVYGIGQNIGWQPGPFDLLRQTIAYNFGINVHHFALVNFDGFQEIIDTLGGVPIAVDCAYEDYRLIGAELPEGAEASDEDEYLFTVDVGYYNMSGAQALWYARTRRSASDFDRGRRQQQILRAMWSKGLDSGQLANLPQLWGQAQSVMTTSVDLTDVLGLLPIALDLEVGRIRSYTLALGYHTQPITVTGNDGVTANVHLPVYETMRPLLEAFYRPPSNSQILVEGATIAVYNGTDNLDWDDVAAERLAWEGFQAFSAGLAEAEIPLETILIDHTGATKGSSRNEIAAVLNVRPENILLEPDPNREADFEVILGDNYSSCTYDGVLDVE